MVGASMALYGGVAILSTYATTYVFRRQIMRMHENVHAVLGIGILVAAAATTVGIATMIIGVI